MYQTSRTYGLYLQGDIKTTTGNYSTIGCKTMNGCHDLHTVKCKKNVPYHEAVCDGKVQS